jgi:tripartite-type tricarboxylate transporter receptor subunit TctC
MGPADAGGEPPWRDRLPGASELIRAGKLRAVAVTTPVRSPALPEVPTIRESLPGLEFTTRWGVVGPAEMPRPVVAKLHGEVTRTVQLPERKERFAAQARARDGTGRLTRYPYGSIMDPKHLFRSQSRR